MYRKFIIRTILASACVMSTGAFAAETQHDVSERLEHAAHVADNKADHATKEAAEKAAKEANEAKTHADARQIEIEYNKGQR